MTARRSLPAPASEIVGREHETAALVSSSARLVTLVGPPGTGKTRLALHAARELAAIPTKTKSQTQVTWVSLVSARSTDDLARLTLAALGLPPATASDVASEVIERALRKGSQLLVLDNFEQLMAAEGALAWVSDRLAGAERLRIWVTSRERLRIAGEHAFEVTPLGTPEPPMARDSMLPPEPDAGVSILTSDAVRLLLIRAPQLEAQVRTDAFEREALAEIARRLEGIPLALELAAGRLVVLAPSELLRQLQGHDAARLDVLGRGSRDASARQATLRGAIDWSWALLTAPERDLLVALSLLRGVFEPTLALDVGCAASTRSRAEVAEDLQSLREKSLLSAPSLGQLALLESVRAFAAEKLIEGEADHDPSQTAARHRGAVDAFVTSLAARASALYRDLDGRAGRAAFTQLSVLREHLVHALALLDGDPTNAQAPHVAAIALGLDALRTRLGVASDLERALRALTHHDALDRDTRAAASRALARLLRDRGEPQEAVAVLERAIESARGADGPRLAMWVDLGELLLAQGRFEDARAPIEEAISGAASFSAILQRAEAAAGLRAHVQGRLPEAEASYLRALDGAQALGDARAEAHALRDLGNVCLQRGESGRARAYYEDALAKSPGDDLRLEGVVRGNLAILHQEDGHLETAYAELRRALSCLRAVGDRPFEAHLLGYLGAVQHERGQLDGARDAYGRALTVLREVRDLRLEGVFSAARAAVHAQKGSFGHAHNDLATADRRLRAVGDPALLVALALHRAAVMLSEAIARGDGRSALLEATALLDQTAEQVKDNDDARFASRMLRRLLPADALTIGEGGSFFEREGCRVELSARPTLARILEALAQARLSSDPQPLRPADLLSAGWPGERVLPQAGQNRVRVALTALRNLGLRSALCTVEGGHMLDPAIPLTRG
jgi:predicted ATPase/predicted negative regulator of RcsB-dependent stress response